MQALQFQKKAYSVTFSESGKVLQLRDTKNQSVDWSANTEVNSFGLPFINGSQEAEVPVPCDLATKTQSQAVFQSLSGCTSVSWEMGEEQLKLEYRNVPDCGPRMGLQLDLNLLDLNTGAPWEAQCMPTTIYTDPKYQYAYFIFTTSDGRYLSLCVDSPFAAWRIKYSYQGHRMTGFQILSQADDLRCDGRPPLPVVDRLSLVFGFPATVEEAFQQISETLGISIAKPEISGGFSGSEIPFTVYGKGLETRLLSPKQEELTKLCLSIPGEYQICTVSENGRVHTASVFCQEEWEPLFDRVNSFYARYFQHDCGAFSRVIWKDTLSPEGGRTFEGVDFGDPEKIMSCRTGEFGGFCAWAMLKNCLLFGEKPALMASIDRYINGWAMNRKGERLAFNGAVCTEPTEFLGRSYSASLGGFGEGGAN